MKMTMQWKPTRFKRVVWVKEFPIPCRRIPQTLFSGKKDYKTLLNTRKYH